MKHNKRIFPVCLFLMATLLSVGCKTQQAMSFTPDQPFYIEGHRGTRGLMPENVTASMIKAIDMGATAIECDVHISRDGLVVVAHDPTINPAITLMEDSSEIPQSDHRKYVLHQMDYAEIKTFDVGSKGNKGYPKQEKIKAHIPLLNDMINDVETHLAKNNLPGVVYNIEIKTNEKQEGNYNPTPDIFVAKVLNVMQKAKIKGGYYLQSFDLRILQEIKKTSPKTTLALLTADRSKTVGQQIALLGFAPEIYSPHFKMATQETVDQTHALGMKFIPWTVNAPEDIKEMISLGADGVITDFAGRAKEIKSGI